MGIIGVNMHGRIYRSPCKYARRGLRWSDNLDRMGVVCIDNQDRMLAASKLRSIEASKLIQYLAA